MKTLTIVVLSLALVGAAFFTRPSEQSFKQVISTDAPTLVKSNDAPEVLATATFRDRYLWTVIQKDSKTAYIGAFGHWFQLGAIAEAPAPAVDVKNVKLPDVKLPV
jgi:hypothetical protein